MFVVIWLLMDEANHINWDKASSGMLFQEEAAEGTQLKPLNVCRLRPMNKMVTTASKKE